MQKQLPYLVPFDRTFRVAAAPTTPPLDYDAGRARMKKKLRKEVKKISKLQEVMYAYDKHSVLLVFQAMDAAGKDSTIRAVLSGINPAGCQVSSFKQPSANELDHDFLWRINRALPQRGRIGVFNRSHYEETLVVRVHPEYLAGQQLPGDIDYRRIWDERFESIRDFERHLARNGTVVIKFWLNVSREEQARRFLSRLTEPEKFWKFSAADIDERQYWDDYMHAYQSVLNETSREYAPWYAIPADNKPYMRYRVAKIIRKTLESLEMGFPEITEDEIDKHNYYRRLLEAGEV
ncbi:polyphosphate kinase 2 family protein [Granulosicoccaceae sp. 1_MG-2023]|nr:polyphosphate kinase 2 family protein [Granulosicoccaceae sp. 1_MG-2023]